MRSLVAVVLPSVLALGAVLTGCRTRSFNSEPLGQIPETVTSAEPLWIPYRVMAGQSYAADPREGRLAELRRVTFDGKSGAPKWHPGSRKLVFERGASGCAELVEMDLSTGETVRLSPANGAAGLGGYLDEAQRLVFLRGDNPSASNPSAACRALFHDGPPRWTPWPANVWVKGPHAEPARALLPGPSTELDVTVSRDKIVFTSLRDGDPELYGARADGTAIRRLTTAPGYDGGASLSPDGTRLVWHAERRPPVPEAQEPATKAKASTKGGAPVTDQPPGDVAIAPESLHLFVAGAEGQHPRALGAFGRYDVEASFLPDSRHVVFSSDYDAAPDDAPTFEIYLVDVDAGPRVGGGPSTERVTFHPGYDGQATVSPDGRWIAFVSTRAAFDQGPGPKGDRDIYVARWQRLD